MKSILKTRTFRWKQLKNEQNGYRIEMWEGVNGTFKEQLKPETAFIYRRGLGKADLLKDTVTINITNKVMIGSAKPSQSSNRQLSMVSKSSILTDLINMRRKAGGDNYN